MAEFINDPELAPGQTALAAGRTSAGTVFAWAPGGEIDAFLAFVGNHMFAVVDGKLYRRESDGILSPFDVTKPLVVLKPMAGDIVFLTPDEFKQRFTMLVEPEPLIVTVDGPMTAAEIAALTPISVYDEPHKVTALTGASSETPSAVDAAAEADAPPLLAPGEGQSARKPGRPKGPTNKAAS